MESLRLSILRFMEEKVKSRRTITHKNPVIFTIKDICDFLHEKHAPSIAREFRNMRKDDLLPCISLGRREHGRYKLNIGKTYSKPAFVSELKQRIETLQGLLRKPKNDFISNLLKEALEKRNDRSLSKVSESQEVNAK